MPTPQTPVAGTQLVLFHGLASTPQEFGLLQRPLKQSGISMHCPEVAGYSHGQMSPSPDWRAWVDSASETVCERLEGATGPVYLGGLCTGAMLALAVAQRFERKLSGLTLLSPLVSYDGWGLPWWYRLRPIAYTFGWTRFFQMRERAPFGLKNERMRKWVRVQLEADGISAVGAARVPLTAVRESERLSEHAVGLARQLALPTLVVHAREDEICSVNSVLKAFDPVLAPHNRLHIVEDSYHMITADNDRQKVADLVADFVLQRREGAVPQASPVAVPPQVRSPA